MDHSKWRGLPSRRHLFQDLIIYPLVSCCVGDWAYVTRDETDSKVRGRGTHPPVTSPLWRALFFRLSCCVALPDPLAEGLVDPCLPAAATGPEMIDHLLRQPDSGGHFRFGERWTSPPNSRLGKLLRPIVPGQIRRGVWIKISGCRASVVTSKPANGGHRKSGQWGWPGTVLFYPFEPVPGKPVLVRQLRGPHLRT